MDWQLGKGVMTSPFLPGVANCNVHTGAAHLVLWHWHPSLLLMSSHWMQWGSKMELYWTIKQYRVKAAMC